MEAKYRRTEWRQTELSEDGVDTTAHFQHFLRDEKRRPIRISYDTVSSLSQTLQLHRTIYEEFVTSPGVDTTTELYTAALEEVSDGSRFAELQGFFSTAAITYAEYHAPVLAQLNYDDVDKLSDLLLALVGKGDTIGLKPAKPVAFVNATRELLDAYMDAGGRLNLEQETTVRRLQGK